jgi:hypothetical protein
MSTNPGAVDNKGAVVEKKPTKAKATKANNKAEADGDGAAAAKIPRPQSAFVRALTVCRCSHPTCLTCAPSYFAGLADAVLRLPSPCDEG